EDGIRDRNVTGVQTCALPIWKWLVLVALTAPILFWAEVSRETLANSKEPHWQLSSYARVAEAIKANSGPEEVVLSFWPGYVFESQRQYFPGMEDHFTYRITSKIPPDARVRYH